MQKRLSVINTFPTSSDLNVKTDVVVAITFDKDISKSSLSGNVFINGSSGEKVECAISYSNRVISITPREPLMPQSSYRVVIKGNNDPNNPGAYKGVTSPIGEFMLGDYTFSFSTESSIKETEYVIDMTPNNIVIMEQPIFKGNVTNDTTNVVQYIDIEIYTSNTFEPVFTVWNGRCSVEDFIEGVSADVYLSDATYYWRARAVSEVNGLWSELCQFGIEVHSDSSVVAGDYVDVDVAFPDSWDMMDANIVDIYPTDGRSHVPTNLKTISIVLDQIVPEEELRYATISLNGEAVDGDTYAAIHGEVDPEIAVVYDHDNNLTILIVTLPVLNDGSDS